MEGNFSEKLRDADGKVSFKRVSMTLKLSFKSLLLSKRYFRDQIRRNTAGNINMLQVPGTDGSSRFSCDKNGFVS